MSKFALAESNPSQMNTHMSTCANAVIESGDRARQVASMHNHKHVDVVFSIMRGSTTILLHWCFAVPQATQAPCTQQWIALFCLAIGKCSVDFSSLPTPKSTLTFCNKYNLVSSKWRRKEQNLPGCAPRLAPHSCDYGSSKGPSHPSPSSHASG